MKIHCAKHQHTASNCQAFTKISVVTRNNAVENANQPNVYPGYHIKITLLLSVFSSVYSNS